jgi:hypothetical protein
MKGDPMNESPETSDAEVASRESSRAESIGRVLFLLAGGVLLSVLVSCACGPTR